VGLTVAAADFSEDSLAVFGPHLASSGDVGRSTAVASPIAVQVVCTGGQTSATAQITLAAHWVLTGSFVSYVGAVGMSIADEVVVHAVATTLWAFQRPTRRRDDSTYAWNVGRSTRVRGPVAKEPVATF